MTVSARVRLEHPPGGWVTLAVPRGRDIERVRDTGTGTAIALLDGLLLDDEGTTGGPWEAAALTAADRDRLLAALHRELYGARIDGTWTCAACQAPFDLDFDLDALLASLEDRVLPEGMTADPAGGWRLPDGRRFRLPTGADELAVAGLPEEAGAQALLERCVLEGSAADDPLAVGAAMEAVAPISSLALDARCPECGADQSVPFDLQHYVLARLAHERCCLPQQVHCLALAYHWSLRETLDLPHDQRLRYVALAEAALTDAGGTP